MALKKSDLYGSLWAGADQLRGGMDAGQYKDYVLTLLFVKYVSDKAKADPRAIIDVPDGGSFDDLIAAKGKPDVGERVNLVLAALAKENGLERVIDVADFDDPDKLGKGRELVERVSNLIGIFQGLDFTGSRAEGDDLLGDAYEYLMRHFATESGKSKGQFYTPAEVSRVLAQLLGIKATTPKSSTVYDPTCGSGSLLLKVFDAAPHGLTIYGQEKDNATRALALMNTILHGVGTATIEQGDTLTSPVFVDGGELSTFDFVVANPPFSVKSWTNGLLNEYSRFDGYGRPPEKNGDYAFLLHILKSLKSAGKAAVILPHGVLFRGNAEGRIRKELVRRGYIKAIIGLPANLFYGTGIPACIIVLDKENAHARTGVFMVDASKGFAKDGPKNRLRHRDMHRIVDAFTRLAEVERYSRLVPRTEIADAKNDYNLNIPRYIDSSEPEDIQDLGAHLHGGIPNRDLDALHEYWDAFPSLRGRLFRPLRPGYSELVVDRTGIRETITSAPEHRHFVASAVGTTTHWWNKHTELLTEITDTTRPTDVVTALGETLLAAFRAKPLIDEYGVYQQLMSYWDDVMHDDVTLIVGLGWDEAAKPRRAIDDKARKLTETPDLVIGTARTAIRYKMDLIPPALVIARYFPEDQAALDELSASVEAAGQEIAELIEEHGGEDGLLTDAMEDEKVTKALATARLKVARYEDSTSDEVALLTKLVGLYGREADLKKRTKEAAAALNKKTLDQYGKLTVDEIRSLVIDDKWGARLVDAVHTEIDSLIGEVIERLAVLGDRYAETVHELDAMVAVLGERVAGHLATMGVK